MRQSLFMESEMEAKIKLSLFYFDILHISTFFAIILLSLHNFSSGK